MSVLRSVVGLLGSGAILLATAAGADGGTVTYKASKADFANPERGFYIADGYDPDHGWTDPLDLDRLREARAKGMTLVRMYYVIGAYRSVPIAAGVIDRVRRDLATARPAGVKMIPRFAYNFGPIGAADAPQARILAHIEQLRPVLAGDADVIAFVEAGFIGTWGEWHSSTNGLDNDASRRAILTKLLQVLPSERAAVVRTPSQKQGVFETKAPLTAAEGFGGSDRARIGAHNDCFLASVDDWGTYSSTRKAVIEAEKSYLAQDNLFVPQGRGDLQRGSRGQALHRLQERAARAGPDALEHDQLRVSPGGAQEVAQRGLLRRDPAQPRLPVRAEQGGGAGSRCCRRHADGRPDGGEPGLGRTLQSAAG